MKRLEWEMVPSGLVLFICLLLSLGTAGLACPETPGVLSLGDESYLPKGAIEAACGVQFVKELGGKKLEEIPLVILSNIDYNSLPGPVREGLVDYVKRGGVLLITGGDRSYGSGGYGSTDLTSILPFRILYPRDWQPSRRGQIESLDPGHPIFSGVNPLKMPLVDSFNNQARGEGSSLIAQFSKFDRQPLIAERGAGSGLVFGIAFDLNQVGSQWPEANRFLLNLIKYLLQRSAVTPR